MSASAPSSPGLPPKRRRGRSTSTLCYRPSSGSLIRDVLHRLSEPPGPSPPASTDPAAIPARLEAAAAAEAVADAAAEQRDDDSDSSGSSSSASAAHARPARQCPYALYVVFNGRTSLFTHPAEQHAYDGLVDQVRACLFHPQCACASCGAWHVEAVAGRGATQPAPVAGWYEGGLWLVGLYVVGSRAACAGRLRRCFIAHAMLTSLPTLTTHVRVLRGLCAAGGYDAAAGGLSPDAARLLSSYARHTRPGVPGGRLVNTRLRLDVRREWPREAAAARRTWGGAHLLRTFQLADVLAGLVGLLLERRVVFVGTCPAGPATCVAGLVSLAEPHEPVVPVVPLTPADALELLGAPTGACLGVVGSPDAITDAAAAAGAGDGLMFDCDSGSAVPLTAAGTALPDLPDRAALDARLAKYDRVFDAARACRACVPREQLEAAAAGVATYLAGALAALTADLSDYFITVRGSQGRAHAVFMTDDFVADADCEFVAAMVTTMWFGGAVEAARAAQPRAH